MAKSNFDKRLKYLEIHQDLQHKHFIKVIQSQAKQIVALTSVMVKLYERVFPAETETAKILADNPLYPPTPDKENIE